MLGPAEGPSAGAAVVRGTVLPPASDDFLGFLQWSLIIPAICLLAAYLALQAFYMSMGKVKQHRELVKQRTQQLYAPQQAMTMVEPMPASADAKVTPGDSSLPTAEL